MNQDTICAIATAQGGAIGIIRITGQNAIEFTDRIFTPAVSAKKLSEMKAKSVTFGQIKEEGELIDEVLVTIFRAPHSYTGENSVEIMCHGSAFILQRILQMLIRSGCRSAFPGEYTQRAFLNGKMDLSQAEAVADLIASSTAATHRLAINQMKGGFSNELRCLRSQLLDITSMIELELDFSEEEVEFADRDNLHTLADKIEHSISRLTESFHVGNVIKNGVPVTIIGETNAGKSTLLNVLLNEEKAIVSSIHGTTRDVIEDTIIINGVMFRFIDTAGIRSTHNEIEMIGIERTYQKLKQADIILWIVDVTEAHSQINHLSNDILPYNDTRKIILVFNKTELIDSREKKALTDLAIKLNIEFLFISAKEKLHTNELEKRLVQTATKPELSQNQIIVTNIRHFEALTHALNAIRRVKEGLSNNLSGDFISQDLRECIFHLSDIMGEVTNDDVLGNIFKNFCIGK